MLGFQHSAKLAEIYGVAVTGTFILDTTLFIAVARSLWHTSKPKLAALGALFLTVEVAFFSSNLAKIAHGAWLSLAVGLLIALVMITWRRGTETLTHNRTEQEGSLTEFLEGLRTAEPPLRRMPGTAIYLNPSKQTTPLALRAEVQHNQALHDKVVIVSIESVSVSHVDDADQLAVEWLGQKLFKIKHVTFRVGYHDEANVPEALALARKRGLLERNLDLEHASYFVSRMTITPTGAPGMSRWRKTLFIMMARNATSPIEAFELPSDRTAMMGSQVAM